MAVSVTPGAASGNLPPQNQEAEVSVLGAILLGEKMLDRVLIDVRLKPDDFYRDRHRLIYRAMLRLKEKASPEPVDVLTVCEELTRGGELDEAGGASYVHSLPSLVPTAGNAPQYAKIVKEHALMRRLLDASREIQDRVLSFSGDPQELVDQAEAALFKVAHEDRTGELRSIEDILHDELDKLEKVSREGIELTGTPTGFRDLDGLTGGFQGGNLIVLAARPAMGKCLAGSALVYDPVTGARRRIDEVVAAGERGEAVWVASVGADLKLHAAKASAVIRSGVQPIFRVTTRLGRRIEATANHPLLTISGWKRVDELEPGARVGVPRMLPEPAALRAVSEDELTLLAALIADGNLTNKTPRFCHGERSAVLPLVKRAAEAFGCGIHDDGRGTATISAGRGAPRNPVRELFERHGLWNLKSEYKFVPDAVFGLDELDISWFLAVLYACDGHVHAGARVRQIGYTTISERLARDVQHLLLRLGIVATIRTLKRPVYDGTGKVAREVRITGQADLLRFCELVPVVGKEWSIVDVHTATAGARRASFLDTLPYEVWDRVVAARGERTWRELSVATGRPPEHNWHVGKRRLSRRLLQEIAGWAGDPELDSLATSDLWWDEIASIEYAGEEETYDLTVPDHHNFVADDIVVHNSALVTNMAENASVDHQRPVALFSLEMSETELAQRFIASQAKLDGDDLRKGRVKPDRWPKVVKATQKLAAAPLFVDDSSDIGIHELRAKARRLHSRHPLGLVIIDYLQLMRPEDTGVSRVEQIGQMSRGLKILARELDVPVIAVSQLSRAVESRPDKKPLLSDLRESGNIEQDADVVIFIYRDEYYNKEQSERPGEADLLIAKHRNGPVGDVVLTFMPRYPKFANLYRDRGGGGDGGPTGNGGDPLP